MIMTECTRAPHHYRYQGWVSASRKPVSDETRQKPVRKAGIYHFPTSEMSEMSETSDQKFFFPKNHFLFK